MKRYIYIILAIIVIAVIAIAVIFTLKKNPSSLPFGLGNGSLPQVGTQGSSSGQNNENGSGASNTSSFSNTTGTITLGEGTPAQTFGMISDGPALDYFVSAQNIITVMETDGSVISITNGTSTILSSSTIPDIISAEFSYDGKKILVSSGSPDIPQTTIFDVASRKWTSAPKGMQSPQWSPTNNYQIAYLVGTNDGGTALGIIDASNLKKAPVVEAALPATDLSLQWIGKAQFVLSERPTSENAGSIWMFSSATGKLTPVVNEKNGAETAWGPSVTSTDGLLFTDGGSPSLQLIDTTGAVIHTLSFNTLPSKCAFAIRIIASSSPESFLYCGIPTDQKNFSSAQLPDAYNMNGLYTSDRIESINLSSGAVNVLRDDTSPHLDMTDVGVFNNILFFINRYDHKLYALTLGS